MKLFSRSSADGPGRRRGLAGRLALSVGLLLPVAATFGAFAAVLGTSPASASIPPSMVGGTVYHPVVPVRIADTRPNSGFQGAGDTLSSGQILTIRVAGLPGDLVPSDAAAVVLNITAVNPSLAGYLTAFAAGQTTPFASTVNFIAGQTIANEATITLGNNGVTSGWVSILNHVGLTDVVVDVQGYYSTDPGDNGGIFGFYFPISYPNPVTGTLDSSPVRVLDTRQNSGQQDAGQTLGPQQQLTFFPGTSSFVPSLTLVPPDATAVVLNLTEATETAPSYLTAWATGFGQPLASNLNWPAGAGPIANRVIVPINPVTGTVSIFNWAGSTDVVADLDGYFAPSVFEPTMCTAISVSNTQTITSTATGGTFDLTVNGVHTNSIPFDASAATVAGALAGILVPVVSVTGGPLPGTPITIVTSSSMNITLDDTNLTGGEGATITDPGPVQVFSATCPAFFPGSVYYGLTTPARIADTRANSNEPYSFSTLGSLSILDIQVPPDVFGPPTMSGFAPSNFDGVDVNVTVTNTTASSFLTVFPAQGGLGLAQLAAHPASDINWVPGEIISNGDLLATIGSIGPFTSMDVFNWSGNVDVVVDVYGYFAIVSPAFFQGT